MDRAASEAKLGRPEKLAQRLGLSPWLTPLLGLARYAAGVDYYRDLAEGAETVADAGRAPSAYEVQLGVDDLFQLGLGLKAGAQVSPTPLRRLAQLEFHNGFYVDITEHTSASVVGGLRALIFRRGARYVPSTDAYLALGLSAAFGEEASSSNELEEVGEPDSNWRVRPAASYWVTASYSYNSPDSVTFFPIPDAHVIGLQLVVGALELARPLVPIVSPRKDKPDSGEPTKSADGGES
ncbi:MAG: hypothetical protein HY791_02765 [Deltaproteobacteria bacterium]|nr:hypothetical protein [Deltaproteobacteria bacterium]